MKKTVFSLAALAFSVINAEAQLTVYENGHVGVATSEAATPVSTFAVGEGWSGYGATVSGTQRGICGVSNGQYLNWSYGVSGQAQPFSASFLCGINGIALFPEPQSTFRTYGVKGIAGNATNGWNYGVFGQLNGTNRGAGVYGTATSGENGREVDGRYAGFFNGATKVCGDLTVTGSVSGMLLSPSASKSSSTTRASSLNEEMPNFSERLSTLTPLTFYTPAPQSMKSASIQSGDTVTHTAPLSLLETQIAERVHYGIDEEQMEAAFPELVYRKEDGSTGINYTELIPVLVQTINELNARIQTLEGKALRKTKASLPADGEPEYQIQATDNADTKSVSIAYRIPANARSAEICICDMNGLLIKSEKTTSPEGGNVSIPTEGLSAGIYLYSLIVDGKVCSTKRVMVNN